MQWCAMYRLGLIGFVVAAAAAHDHSQEKKIVVDGSTTLGPIMKAFKTELDERNEGYQITVSESGSGNGAKSLINNTCDAAAMSRFMKEGETRSACAAGVIPTPHVVAYDGIAMVVHPRNPVSDLSMQQIKDIYLGKINNWKDVGGPDLKIHRISRDTNSGTYETFEELVMNHERPAADTEYVGSNGQARQRVGATPASIGYLSLGFLDRSTKPITVSRMEPSLESIQSGRYPIARPLYVFTNGYPKLGTALHTFVTLHLTPRGQQIIESIGYVPVTNYSPAEQERAAG